MNKEEKTAFKNQLKKFGSTLYKHVEYADHQWTVKGFIDIFKNLYTISGDTKIISKILELHIFPKLLRFSEENDYTIVLAEHQNYYPDISFVHKKDSNIKFAVDLKTTYRLDDKPDFCNGFTLGSHGEYFINRKSTKNIQFAYDEYLGHFCLGIIYSRVIKSDFDETRILALSQLESVASVINNFKFFICEKWKVASDRSGSGNTANIGSIDHVQDLINEKGMFINLGEKIFDDYWMNYNRMVVKGKDNKNKKLTKLEEFLTHKNMDLSLINPRRKKETPKKAKE